MKKIFASLLVVCCIAAAAPQAQAQQYYKLSHPNEISASYGVSLLGSAIGTVVSKGGRIASILGLDEDVTVKNGGTKGIVNLGYSYQLNKVVSVGGAVGFNRMSINMQDETGKISAAAANIYMIMSTGKFDWFRTRSDVFGMYSKVGLGIMAIGGTLVEDVQKTAWLPTAQLSLVGLEVGKGFSGFLELGAGMQGIVQAGIRARF